MSKLILGVRVEIILILSGGFARDVTGSCRTILQPARRTSPTTAGLLPLWSIPLLGSSVRGASVCLGQVFSYSGHWDEPHSAAPDGSYAICRANDRSVELLTDFVGSRTLWYYFDDNLLLASSSQRALVTLLGSFELNREAIPWLLSSGCLGPEAAWTAAFTASVRTPASPWIGPPGNFPFRRSLSNSSRPVPRRYAELLQEALSTVCESLDVLGSVAPSLIWWSR